VGRRRRRLSDDETQRQMLAAAMAMVDRGGLTVSLEHLSLEDVIRDAGVSRSAVYRRWPYKDLFFGDLLKEIARAAAPTAVVNDEESLAAIRRMVLDHIDRLTTPTLRHELFVELLRREGLRDFQTVCASTEWRTYLALHATFLSLADGDLREDVRAALAEAERGFTARIAAAWARLAGLLGYRLRPELGATFELVAGLVSAALRGLALMAPSTPDIATRRVQAAPFGTPPAEWSTPALGLAAIAVGFLEPDPTIEWTDRHIAAIRQALDAADGTATQP
jgi:AcrR family transcriptional regulator